MAVGGIGAALPRLEDARLLQGQGRYSDDFTHEGQARAFVLRSPHPHARIVSIDSSAARAMPGVLLILTGADVAAEGLKPIPHIPQAQSPPDIRLDNLDGSPHLVEQPPILAIDTVRFVGEGGGLRRRRDGGARQGRRRGDRDRLREPGPDRRHRRRCAGRQSDRRPARASPRPIMSCGSRPPSSGSPACRWSRAPRSATTIPRPGATRSMPAAAPSCGQRRRSRSSSASRPRR